MTEKLDVLISAEKIQVRLQELAQQVREDYGDEPLLLVGILKGSYQLISDFSRYLGGEVKIDFAQISSYGEGTTSSGLVRFKKDLDLSLEGEHVLIVEDIVDTGLTLNHLLELFQTRRPASMRVLTLLSKPAARAYPARVDYLGFEIDDVFVVGYGLDYAERYRNLPYVGVVRSQP